MRQGARPPASSCARRSAIETASYWICRPSTCVRRAATSGQVRGDWPCQDVTPAALRGLAENRDGRVHHGGRVDQSVATVRRAPRPAVSRAYRRRGQHEDIREGQGTEQSVRNAACREMGLDGGMPASACRTPSRSAKSLTTISSGSGAPRVSTSTSRALATSRTRARGGSPLQRKIFRTGTEPFDTTPCRML